MNLPPWYEIEVPLEAYMADPEAEPEEEDEEDDSPDNGPPQVMVQMPHRLLAYDEDEEDEDDTEYIPFPYGVGQGELHEALGVGMHLLSMPTPALVVAPYGGEFDSIPGQGSHLAGRIPNPIDAGEDAYAEFLRAHFVDIMPSLVVARPPTFQHWWVLALYLDQLQRPVVQILATSVWDSSELVRVGPMKWRAAPAYYNTGLRLQVPLSRSREHLLADPRMEHMLFYVAITPPYYGVDSGRVAEGRRFSRSDQCVLDLTGAENLSRRRGNSGFGEFDWVGMEEEATVDVMHCHGSLTWGADWCPQDVFGAPVVRGMDMTYPHDETEGFDLGGDDADAYTVWEAMDMLADVSWDAHQEHPIKSLCRLSPYIPRLDGPLILRDLETLSRGQSPWIAVRRYHVNMVSVWRQVRRWSRLQYAF